jgi:xylulokinase
VGITLRHTRDHLARAVLEGVTFGLADCLALVRDLGLPAGKARLSGGGARSPFWRQLIADVLEVPVDWLEVSQGASFGAALLAGVGVGAWGTVAEACRGAVREAGSLEPGPDAPVYGDLHARFRALYPALRDEFRRS